MLWHNSFNGWGVTAVDSLDTMLLMGFTDEFNRAVSLVKQMNFTIHRVRGLRGYVWYLLSH